MGLETPAYYPSAAPFVLPIDLNSNTSWAPNPYFTWANHLLRNGAAIHRLAEQWHYNGEVLGAHLPRSFGPTVPVYGDIRTAGAQWPLKAGASLGMLPHRWQPGEIIPDDWAIPIPEGTAPGPYQIVVGLYDYRNMGGIYLTGAQLTAQLGTVQVVPG